MRTPPETQQDAHHPYPRRYRGAPGIRLPRLSYPAIPSGENALWERLPRTLAWFQNVHQTQPNGDPKTCVKNCARRLTAHKHAAQETLIQALNPQIVGWSNYYAHVTSARVFQTLDHTVYAMLKGWAVSRHPNKKKHWITSKYWRVDDGKGWTFQAPHGGASLARHAHTSIQRHVKVQGARSPYDGDWVYWSRRVGRHPDVPPRVARLLKQQQGRVPSMRVVLHGWRQDGSRSHPAQRARRE